MVGRMPPARARVVRSSMAMKSRRKVEDDRRDTGREHHELARLLDGPLGLCARSRFTGLFVLAVCLYPVLRARVSGADGARDPLSFLWRRSCA